MFRIIRVLSALDKFFRPLHGHFHWDHFTYFRHGAHELYEMRAISPELQANIQQHERITHGVAKLSQNLVNRIYGLSKSCGKPLRGVENGTCKIPDEVYNALVNIALSNVR
jgi:hypothetical protein